ncbi:hypothetical protein DFP72DRAFT_857202 [Ephemerocybe angulata]|uniref:Uncharacterized protein n=1 Tax=Ephemerocybe angulata TaxID=980116 RepID=A0A8H6LUS9_9AGAR|nr:hypothetical protein DFP72DRAFT_857202 [Tulosesus angulatus]
MRLPFVALFSIVASMACTGYAHSDHDHALHAREFVDDLSSQLSDISTRYLVSALGERLERRRKSPRKCCRTCGKEFPNTEWASRLLPTLTIVQPCKRSPPILETSTSQTRAHRRIARRPRVLACWLPVLIDLGPGSQLRWDGWAKGGRTVAWFGDPMAGMEDQDFACAGYDRPRRFPFNRVWLSTATVARVLSPICAPTDRPTALAHRAVPCTVDTAAISSMHVKTEHHHRSESRQTAGCTDTLLADGRTEEGVAKTCG